MSISRTAEYPGAVDSENIPPAMARAVLNMESNEEVAFRLEATRLALGYPQQAEFCRQIKVAPQKWSNAVTGDNAVPREIISKMRARFGISADWLLYGDLRGIPSDLARAIAQAEEDLAQKPRWKSKRA